MEVVTLSTKGQLVVPASIRAALQLRAGARLSASILNDSIVIKPLPTETWVPLNPAGARLSSEELSQPVDFSREPSRG
jgi:AbrB family looped-hinge helix DNA binding protein